MTADSIIREIERATPLHRRIWYAACASFWRTALWLCLRVCGLSRASRYCAIVSYGYDDRSLWPEGRKRLFGGAP